MIRETSKQLTFLDFKTPFGMRLRADNRWVKLARSIPWDELGAVYEEGMSSGQGRPAKAARVVIGAMIIKHKLKLSDEETIEQIRENAYLQHFIGYTEYRDEQPFAPSLFVDIRRRMGGGMYKRFERVVIETLQQRQGRKLNKGKEDDERPPSHKGKLRVDATVVEQGIKYPTDQGLLNEAREISEEIIDVLYPCTDLTKKPRTYRRKARQAYLAFAKKRKPSRKQCRQAIKAQLQYLRRNLGHIETCLDTIEGIAIPLPPVLLRKYWIIQHVYTQQQMMYQSKERRCADRIVSISQPQVRPIVRGKASKHVEFGAKLSVSLTDAGIACVDRLSWDAFHEAGDLPAQVEAYRDRHGWYPEVVLGDRLYGTRENRAWLKAHGIRFGGRQLGRPPKDEKRLKEQKQQQRQDELERIPIEGKFGQGKRSYGLGRVEARTALTAQGWIGAAFLVMNLLKLSRFSLRSLAGALAAIKNRLRGRLELEIFLHQFSFRAEPATF